MEEAVSQISTIDPEKIRQELSDLWVDMAKEKDGDAGVLRACSMTLVAAVDETDDPAKISETIALLMREHPSRAIVVRVRDSTEFFLSAQVVAQCWMPFGNRRQICCEQVEITASIASLADLPAVLLPLMVADLPIVLWAHSSTGMKALFGIAGKVILDSAASSDFATVINLSKRVHVGDLAWTRLTRWRELIAQIFENKCYLAELPGLVRARITYTGERPTSSSFYLAAWLERQETIWERGAEDALALETASGEMHTRIRRTGGEGVEVTIHEQINHAVFQASTDYSLLREELSIVGRDPVFEAVLPRAAAMAERFV
jgi:glucose-6-phosphate dehydrogenase assembly protein OpcA